MNGVELFAAMHARAVSERRDQPTAKDRAGVLATVPLFTGVSKRRLRELARHATSAEFAPGETIIFAGDRDNSLYLILGGQVKVLSTRATPTLGSGDYFGELAMIDSGPRSATVVATSYVDAMKLPAPLVVSCARRHPAITFRMLGGLTTRLRLIEAHAAASLSR